MVEAERLERGLIRNVGLGSAFTIITCEWTKVDKVLNKWSGIAIDGEWCNYEPLSASMTMNGFGDVFAVVLLKLKHKEKLK